MKAKRAALAEALTGRFDDHHGELARMLLDQIDALTAQIERLASRIEELIAAIPVARGVDAAEPPGRVRGRAGTRRCGRRLPAWMRSPGQPDTAQVILAEVGLDMSRFPTAGHLASWAKLSPRTIQSGPKSKSGRTGQGNPYLKGALGEAAAAAARTSTFLGERYRRIVKRRGSSGPWSPSPAPSWSSPGTCSPTPPRASANSVPATTPAVSTPAARPATTSASLRHSGSPSPSLPQPEAHHRSRPPMIMSGGVGGGSRGQRFEPA